MWLPVAWMAFGSRRYRCGMCAPGAIIVEEAGGRVTDFVGHAGVYEGNIAATNGQIHAGPGGGLATRHETAGRLLTSPREAWF